MLVGDADAFGAALEAADLGTVVIERDEAPHALGPIPTRRGAAVAVDEGEDAGPTAGAEDPDLPGTADDPAAADTDADDREDASETFAPSGCLVLVGADRAVGHPGDEPRCAQMPT